MKPNSYSHVTWGKIACEGSPTQPIIKNTAVLISSSLVHLHWSLFPHSIYNSMETSGFCYQLLGG